MPRPASGLTLVETMLATLLLALLASAVAVSLSRPLAAARADDAAALLGAFDAAARQAAVAGGKPVRMAFDLSVGRLQRFEGGAVDAAATVSLPAGCRIDRVKIGAHAFADGTASVAVSPRGWSASYAVRLTGRGPGEWVVVAGLSGEVSEANDENTLPVAPRTPGYDAD